MAANKDLMDARVACCFASGFNAGAVGDQLCFWESLWMAEEFDDGVGPSGKEDSVYRRLDRLDSIESGFYCSSCLSLVKGLST